MTLPVIWKCFAETIGITQKEMREFYKAATEAGEDPDSVLAQFIRDSVSDDRKLCTVSQMSCAGSGR